MPRGKLEPRGFNDGTSVKLIGNWLKIENLEILTEILISLKLLLFLVLKLLYHDYEHQHIIKFCQLLNFYSSFSQFCHFRLGIIIFSDFAQAKNNILFLTF